MSAFTVRMPVLSVNDSEGTVAKIKAGNRDEIKEGDVLFVVEDTKAVSEIKAERHGFLLLQCAPFDVKKRGDALALIFDKMEDLDQYERISRAERAKESSDETVNATKKAIALAGELGVDIRELSKMRNGEVIRVKDVQAVWEKRNVAPASGSRMPAFRFDRERVVIVGAGKGAEVAIDILLDDHNKEIVGLVDDNVKIFSNYNIPVLECTIADFPDKIDRSMYDTVIISIGANLQSMRLREKLYEDYKNKQVEFTNAIAQTAEIRRGVKIGTGNLIGAHSYIGTLTRIGNNNSISYGVCIGHHNVIGSHNLIAPGVVTSGSDTVGDGCILPAGVSVINRVTIGNRVVLPVGHHVVRSLPDGEVIKYALE